MARSINKVILIGNLTRDPQVRYTGNNSAVASFGLATNRSWTSQDSGERVEKVDYHNVVAWSKLAENCERLLGKGDTVYVEGRLQTRSWQSEDGQEKKSTEIVIDNMVLLTSRSGKASNAGLGNGEDGAVQSERKVSKGSSSSNSKQVNTNDSVDYEDPMAGAEDISDDIPF